MKKAIIESESGLTQVELKYLEQKFTDRTKEETGYLDKKIEAEKTAKSFWEKMFGASVDGQSLIEIEHDIDKTAADELFNQVKYQFSESISNANRILNQSSKSCWQRNALDMRAKITSLIMETPKIIEDKKNELSEVIASYQDIPLEESEEEVFLREDFDKYLFAFGAIKIGETYRLNLSKLGMTYNRKLKEYVDNTYTKISANHTDAFSNWSSELLENITIHIQELNPTLRGLVENIKVDSEKISDLENRQTRLTEYISQIENLMAWKNR